MKPIISYLKDFFAFKNVVGDDKKLLGLAKADELFQQLIISKKVPGLAISVLKNKHVFFQRGYGYSDLEKNTLVDPQTTVFRIASVSKPIAATALAHMVADGIINLDASFYSYVPYFPKKKWDFTIRQLASHTAGIRGYMGVEYGLNKPYAIKESMNIFQNDDLLFEPGTGYHYNSYDWVMISLAMQEASGIPFEEYVNEKVLVPLALKNTFPETPNVLDILARGTLKLTNFYSKSVNGFRKAVSVNNYFKLAGGGYLSTAEDIAKMGQAYLDKRILNQEIIEQFVRSETVNNELTYYGLGWQVSKDKKGRPFYGHIGNGVGGYANFFVYPDQQMVVAILVNTTNPNIQSNLEEVIEVLLEN